MRDGQDVAGTLTQRRHVDCHFAQAVVQVLAELLFRYEVLEILVGRCNDAHVDRNLLATANAFNDLVLEEAQQLGLQRQRHVADLIQEQRAAIGVFDLAGRGLHGAGKCALLVAEEFGFQQLLRNGRAVDGDESLVASRAQGVQCARQQFLAGAALAQDQHCDVRGGDLLDHAADVLHRAVDRDDALEALRNVALTQPAVLPAPASRSGRRG